MGAVRRGKLCFLEAEQKLQTQKQLIMSDSSMKTFVFQKIDTQQATIINYSIVQQQETVDLNSILRLHCPVETYNIWIYSPDRSQFISAQKMGCHNGMFPYALFQPSIILIRFIEKGAMLLESESLKNTSCDSSNEQKDSRYRQRTIGQVIALIKKWRNLHLYEQGIMRKRLSLQEAAKVVGIPKKSLDDYYCQLRLGQQYHFDYVHNLQQKMGVLRNHIKVCRPQKEQNRRRQNQKHPKNLKIIQYFDLATNKFKNQSQLMKGVQLKLVESPEGSQRSASPINNIQIPLQGRNEENRREEGLADVPLAGERSPISKELFDIEDVFFRDFEMILGQEVDPYYIMEKDLRREDVDYDSNSLMFFE